MVSYDAFFELENLASNSMKDVTLNQQSTLTKVVQLYIVAWQIKSTSKWVQALVLSTNTLKLWIPSSSTNSPFFGLCGGM